ncbi:hypothetical protein [Mycobacterium shigaense]|uniref:TetR family transcriptional regulator n=1 Tax=Mycobacterium shigaense TaxID=722731 RepID=A0A1Z4EF52_9MYCO|nr:hypothetical protein [Mycobacterium shigaense]BAX91601.1 TetR family transcriptional regulator [Mycobacterium shigaense]
MTVRICDTAVEKFGQQGFDAELTAIGEAATVSANLIASRLGPIEAPRKFCDSLTSTGAARSDSLQSVSPSLPLAESLAEGQC